MKRQNYVKDENSQSTLLKTDSDIENMLRSSVKNGNLKKAIKSIQALEEHNPEHLANILNTLDQKGRSLLHLFTYPKYPPFQLLDILISSGMNIDITDSNGLTPLQALLSTHNFNKKNTFNPLSKSDFYKAMLFVRKEATVDAQQIALLIHSAIALDNLTELQTLLQHPQGSVTAKVDNMLPLYQALSKTPQNPEIVDFLLKSGSPLMDHDNNPENLPRLNKPVLKIMHKEGGKNLLAVYNNQEKTAIHYTPLKTKANSIIDVLRNFTLCQESTNDIIKSNMDKCFTELLSFDKDYTTQLLVSALALSMLLKKGLLSRNVTICVANAPTIFPFTAYNISGYFMGIDNMIMLGGISKQDELTRSICHETLHGLLTMVSRDKGHDCKPYGRENKEQKQLYRNAIEQSRIITQGFTKGELLGGESPYKFLFGFVDNYEKEEDKHKEYVARTLEAYIYTLQYPELKDTVSTCFAPLLHYIEQHVIPPLEVYVATHPDRSKLALPDIVKQELGKLDKPQKTKSLVSIQPPKPEKTTPNHQEHKIHIEITQPRPQQSFAPVIQEMKMRTEGWRQHLEKKTLTSNDSFVNYTQQPLNDTSSTLTR